MVCPNGLEEGEFTPILSKKSKKLVKLADKTRLKTGGSKHTVHSLLHKGAKHKLFL